MEKEKQILNRVDQHWPQTKMKLEDGKDEYWGFWEKCGVCQEVQPYGGNYCIGCGGRIERSKADLKKIKDYHKWN